MAKLSDLGRIVTQALQSKDVLEAAGEIAIERIPKRTRLGKGVKENLGVTHTLPQLTERTVKIRQKLKKRGALLGPGATPKKSAINRTGEALNSIGFTVKTGELDIHLDPSQQAKVDDLIRINPNYSFMKLSKAEFSAMLKAINNRINRILSRINITDL